MRKTANYGLNQWDPEDRILWEDFNRDNERIDGAIAAIDEKSLWQPLCTIVTEEDTNEITVDIDGFDWEDWLYVHLEVEAYTEVDRTVVSATVNGVEVLQAWGNATGSSTEYLGHAVLFPLKDKRRSIVSLASNGYMSVDFYKSSYKFQRSSAHPFVLTGKSGAEILQGTKISAWGVR